MVRAGLARPSLGFARVRNRKMVEMVLVRPGSGEGSDTPGESAF